jgi:glutathione S-transferase
MEQIVRLGGEPGHAARVRDLRERFEALTGAFTPEDDWFEERIRAFWCDAVTRGGFAAAVASELGPEHRLWIESLQRTHRGLFRAEGLHLVDVWSGAEFRLTNLDEETRDELAAAAGQLFDGRVVAGETPSVIALLPGAVFHSCDATSAIEHVLQVASQRAMKTDDTLDALLRMGRARHASPHVKASYAYRTEGLVALRPAMPVRRLAKLTQ